MRRAIVRRLCLLLSPSAAFWAHLLSVTDGIAIGAGPFLLSSRNPTTPIALAAIAAAAVVLLSPSGARRRTLAADIQWWSERVPSSVRSVWSAAGRTAGRVAAGLPGSPSVAACAACALAVCLVLIAAVRGADVAGGSDSAGYVSYARLWAAGTLHVEPPLAQERMDPGLAAAVPPDALVPLGFELQSDGSLAPMYSPGLPMLMGAFEWIGGPRALFLVVPLLGGLAVWATYLLGRTVGGPGVGLAAAALLAASPIFLHQLMAAPMSDIPAMAWWALVLVLLPSASRAAAFGAGAAAGAAILTRPNLAFLALVPGIVLIGLAAMERPRGGNGFQRLLAFGAGAAPACLALAWLNAHWYGSPLLTGYGTLDQYFRLAYLPANLARYPRWLLDTQTPVVLLAVAAPLLVRRGWARSIAQTPSWVAMVCAAFAVAVFASYAFYTPFDAWWMLRFLLPAFPPMLVLTALAVVTIARRGPAAPMTASAVVAAAVMAGLVVATRAHAFSPEGEGRFVAAAEAVADLPDRAVIVAREHTGSVRYYTDRPILRYDRVPRLDAALAALRRLGYHPYFLLEGWEEAEFRARHAASSRAGALDWPPMAIIEPGGVRLYDTAAVEAETGEALP